MTAPKRAVQYAAVLFSIGIVLVYHDHAGASEKPVSILAERISGHIHPSICRTRNGTLIVVFKGANSLVCARSMDDGNTWSKTEPIAASAKRPDIIRKVTKFEVYPGTADTLPEDRILVTWNYIADDKAKDGYYERALLYTISSDQGRTWSDQQLIGPLDGKHLGAVRHNVLPVDRRKLAVTIARRSATSIRSTDRHFESISNCGTRAQAVRVSADRSDC